MKKAIVIAIVVIAALAGAFRYSKSTTHQLFGEIVPRVDTDRRVVALTFDDGPVAQSAPEILSILRQNHVHATFFVIGAQVAESPAVLPQLIADGHQIGNHTWDHDRMWFKSPSWIASQIERTDAVIRAAGWKSPIVFRAPYGKKLVALPWYLAKHHRVHITWDVAPDSASPNVSTDRIIADVVAQTRPGSIILLHPWYANRAATRAAITPVITQLRARGYDFVTVDELLRLRHR